MDQTYVLQRVFYQVNKLCNKLVFGKTLITLHGNKMKIILNSMHIEQLGEIFPPPSHNTVGVCNQVDILILYYITSRLVPLLKATDALKQVPNILDLIVSFKFLNFISHICLLFVPEMPAIFTPYLDQIIYIALAWHLYPLNFSPLPLIQKTLTFFIKPGFILLKFIQTQTLFR